MKLGHIVFDFVKNILIKDIEIFDKVCMKFHFENTDSDEK
jgi:hypothetical protein